MLCFSAGRVKVILEVERDGESAGEYVLTLGMLTEGDVREIEMSGLVLRLVGVEPNPVVGEQMSERDYVVELLVGG